MRAETVRAASRRGCVCAMVPRRPRPAAKQALGNWVVLPEPVSPATMSTWLRRSRSTISPMRDVMGRAAGKSGCASLAGGTRARLAGRPFCGPEAGIGRLLSACQACLGQARLGQACFGRATWIGSSCPLQGRGSSAGTSGHPPDLASWPPSSSTPRFPAASG